MDKEDRYTTRELEHYFGDLKTDIAEIKTQTIKTNGRVTKLEKYLLIVGCVTGTLVLVKFPEVFDIVSKFI